MTKRKLNLLSDFPELTLTDVKKDYRPSFVANKNQPCREPSSSVTWVT